MENRSDQGAMHVPSGGGRSFWLAADLHTFKAVGEDTNGAYALAALLNGFLVNPTFYLWLGLTLLRGRP